MDIKEVYEIWDRFEKSDIDEIGKDKLRLKKKADIDEAISRLAGSIPVSGVSADTANSKVQSESDGSCSLPYIGSPVKAPLVGTFYRASSPGASPFVEEGSMVKKGDVIGIIEAMKLMNELVAPRDGKIEKILVSDGEMVEYDQVIMSIE